MNLTPEVKPKAIVRWHIRLPRTLRIRVLLIAMVGLGMTACDTDSVPPDDRITPTVRTSPDNAFRYDREYPSIGYTDTPAHNRIARLIASLESGLLQLEYRRGGGYLDSLLEALEINVASQMLVFSATSLQVGRIQPNTPRAIYFNDDTYVAFVQNAEALEIATVDTRLGPVFYTLAQEPGRQATLQRRISTCLRCHDSYSMTGGGVPRFIVGSGYIGREGQLISHEGWILTSDATPLRFRWGGWYVSGFHGEQVHLGNFAVDDAEQLQQLDSLRVGNVGDLQELLDTRPYRTPFSDIVALLVFGHQTRVQNVMTRVSYDLRTLLASGTTQANDGNVAAAITDSIAGITEPLVKALLLTDAAEISDRIEGTSGFTEYFSALGPRDSNDRSLRELNLGERLFEYPLSYLIYSDAFDALPPAAHRYVYRRLDQILSGNDSSPDFAHLSVAMRNTLRQILIQTKPAFASSLER